MGTSQLEYINLASHDRGLIFETIKKQYSRAQKDYDLLEPDAETHKKHVVAIGWWEHIAKLSYVCFRLGFQDIYGVIAELDEEGIGPVTLFGIHVGKALTCKFDIRRFRLMHQGYEIMKLSNTYSILVYASEMKV